ncbi:hypothetical protein [Burkholderia cepacia]|uniref:hypothetical protein n=1 Tax=Burkholderia cepacia TaxID=292 RepID=UPI000A3EC804|nr:hypothetical protein [Burkholderia cepacia]
MSTPSNMESTAPEQPSSAQPATSQTPPPPRSDAVPAGVVSEAQPLFASVQAELANIREDARAKARQMIADAERALLESLRALHASDKPDRAAGDSNPASRERKES